MPYPPFMEESIRKLEVSRQRRMKEEIPLISSDERDIIVKRVSVNYC